MTFEEFIDSIDIDELLETPLSREEKYWCCDNGHGFSGLIKKHEPCAICGEMEKGEQWQSVKKNL